MPSLLNSKPSTAVSGSNKRPSKTANPSDWCNRTYPHTICLFDVDGTLSASRKIAEPQMLQLLEKLKRHVVIGFVGGSDLSKQQEQLGADVVNKFDFGFSENGATAYRLGQLISRESFIGFLGEEKYKQLVNFALTYIASLDIPIKRGTFIEYRAGMVNLSPIGRNCSHEERLQFAEYDDKHGIRKEMVRVLKEKFADFNLQFSIGGQISIDVFPKGWDKTFCLKHLQGEGFDTIHFFGDKTEQGGNDYELYTHPAVKGHAVRSPDDTARIVNELFFQNS